MISIEPGLSARNGFAERAARRRRTVPRGPRRAASRSPTEPSARSRPACAPKRSPRSSERNTVPVRASEAAGWDVCVILTPSAYRWLSEDTEGEIEALTELTGHPVRRQYKLLSQPDVLPAPDAILVAPPRSPTTPSRNGPPRSATPSPSA
ncbi:hypothetical protein GCM10023220_35530 [Streptomyces ziwulingensis]|uniref:Uncharacterized protein n=1 Tax=Streptomyces ziwulingensis TaxID=1045501 RepID=A0ABP9C3R8_9ACTN